MSTELIAIIAIIAMLLVNVVGWSLTIRRNDKSSSKREGKFETKVCNLENGMKSLPCNTNPEYSEGIGAMAADIRSINDRLTRIEDKIFDGA